MTEEMNTNAGAGPVERMVRPGSEARWYCLSREGMATLCTDEEDAKEIAAESWVAWPQNGPYRVAQMVDADTAESLRTALTELRDRIKAHPAYANLTEDEECDVGGDTAELSYLARVADAALGPNGEVRGASPEGEASSREAATSTVELTGDGQIYRPASE